MAPGLDHKLHPMIDADGHPDCSGKQESARSIS